jgi:hypothetical protein
MSARFLRPRASGGFLPSRIANLAGWWDMAVASTYTLNGTGISEWRDRISSLVVSQATAGNQPQLVTVDGWTNVASSEGADSRFLAMQNATLDLVRNVNGVTVFCVHRPTTVSGARVMVGFSRGDNADSGRLALGIGVTTTNFECGGRRLDADSFASAASGTPVVNTKYVQAGILDYVNSDAYVYANGLLIASNMSFQTTGSSSDTRSAGGNFFRLSASQPYRGAIAEVLVYQRVISDAERKSVERYLGDKWGITVS